MDGEIGEPACPVAVVDGHAVDCGEAIVVPEMEHHDVEDERCM